MWWERSAAVRGRSHARMSPSSVSVSQGTGSSCSEIRPAALLQLADSHEGMFYVLVRSRLELSLDHGSLWLAHRFPTRSAQRDGATISASSTRAAKCSRRDRPMLLDMLWRCAFAPSCLSFACHPVVAEERKSLDRLPRRRPHASQQRCRSARLDS